MLSTKSVKYILFSLLLLCSCSSEPVKPPAVAWTLQPSRTVDNGYIVYVGKASANTAERAQFRAEGIALEDLANECSFIPKGSRIEDRYLEKDKNIYTAYVKVGLEFQNCDFSKKAIQPDEIKNLASLPFTLQLKKYQDLTETGEMPQTTELTEVTPPDEYVEAPTRAVSPNDNIHFFVTRQYVAYQKEIVVLSPPTAFAAQSQESQKFVAAVSPSMQQIQITEKNHPQYLKQTTTWSQIHDRPVLVRPQNLRPRMRAAGIQAAPMMKNPGPYRSATPTRLGQPASKGRGGGGRGRRRKRNLSEENH